MLARGLRRGVDKSLYRLNSARLATQSASQKAVLVYGGGGELGRGIIQKFKGLQWRTVSADFVNNPESDENCLIDAKRHWAEQAASILKTSESRKFDAVVHTAGGWVGGTVNSDAVFANADRMWEFCTRSAISASHIASKVLRPNGLLVITGANAARSPTPDMLEYGMAKAAVHHLVRSLASPKSGMPAGTKVVAMLPITIDTANNRKAMPKGKFSTWTPTAEFADRVAAWVKSPADVQNGGLYVFRTENSKTTAECVKQ